MIRYRKGGKLIPATWDEAISHTAKKLEEIANATGASSIAVVGSPRITNEANYALYKFATEVVGTENYTATDAFNLVPFFENLGATLATHRDIRHAKTILLIGGEPEELQPLTGKQIRQAVRNGGAKLVIVNSVPIRLREQAAQFIHINRGTEDAAVLALADSANDSLAAQKLGVDTSALASLRETINQTSGDVVIMFGGELSAAAQAIVAQLPYSLGGDDRRVLLHPLPLYNNSVGAHDMSRDKAKDADKVLNDETVRALIVAGDPMLPKVSGTADNPQPNRDFVVLWELFISEVSEFARQAAVILPAASF